jgi:uncharacterized RmlC-like cupin family protein
MVRPVRVRSIAFDLPVARVSAQARLSFETAQSSGMRRFAAISGDLAGSERIWMGQTHVAPGPRSADHHHGASETGIYVVSGHPVFVFVEDGVETRIEASPGDYVYLPPFVAHHEEAVVILARTTQEAIVVNLPGL